MSKVIRVSSEVYEAMRDRAEPFKDTPDSVLRRVLGLEPQPRDPRAKPLVDTKDRKGKPGRVSGNPAHRTHQQEENLRRSK